MEDIVRMRVTCLVESREKGLLIGGTMNGELLYWSLAKIQDKVMKASSSGASAGLNPETASLDLVNEDSLMLQTDPAKHLASESQVKVALC